MKDPDAVLDYQVDWSAWLSVGDFIIASAWVAVSLFAATGDAGITIDSNTFDTTTATVWLSGGGVGAKYRLTNHVTTADGREDDRSFTIQMKEF